jgi:nucleotide-binding universal stress UspA family protein
VYRKALLPIDGSELSAAAIAEAARLLTPGEGEVLAIEVVDTVSRILSQTTPAGFALNGVGLSPDVVQQVVRGQHATAEEDLARARELLARAGVTRVTTRVVEGAPGAAIVDAAHAEGCEVVVMATHGRSGLSRTVLGSVADHVVRHLRGIPVLLIHPEGEAADR